MIVKGNGVNNKARIELTDDGGERFETIMNMGFEGWKEIKIPLSSLVRRKDWQPNNVPDDGLTLSAVEGISISLAEKGAGTWLIDAIGIIPGK